MISTPLPYAGRLNEDIPLDVPADCQNVEGVHELVPVWLEVMVGELELGLEPLLVDEVDEPAPAPPVPPVVLVAGCASADVAHKDASTTALRSVQTREKNARGRFKAMAPGWT